MTSASPDTLGYNAIRQTVAMYNCPTDIYRVSGDDASGLLLYVIARSTEYASPGAVIDSLILNEDGSVRGVVTLIWGEDDVLVLADKELRFEEIAAAATTSLELSDVTVANVSDSMKLVFFEGPHAWRVAEKFAEGDVAQIQFSTFMVSDEPVAGGQALVGRHGSTGEFGYFVAVDSPTEDLSALVEAAVTELNGAIATAAALRRCQLEMHHPVLPEQAANATVREASVTWLLSAMREDDFLGSAGWNANPELTRGVICVTCPAGTLPEIGTPVLAGDTKIGHVSVVAATCGLEIDLGMVLVDVPFNVPGLTLTANGVEINTVAAPTLEPASVTGTVGDLG